jgi:ATP-dependent DNA helicase Rep
VAASGEAADPHDRLAARVYAEYDEHLKAYNAFDFDDLILKPVELLRTEPAVLSAWRERIRYLLVDEYQDTNLCQYELVKHLAGASGTFTVVGDDDQSIYAWRGARPENLRQLAEDFPNLRVVKLEQNYRSSSRILRCANAVIANNPHVFEKRLWSELPMGEKLRVLVARSEEHEAERIVSELQYHKFKHNTEYRDYAILFRENHQARVFERVLRERRIPYRLSGASSFFDRTEIKDIMAYLRLIANPHDDSAFLRVVNTPRREIGPATLEGLARHAARLGTSLLAAAGDAGLSEVLSARQVATLRVFTEWLAELARRAERDQPLRLIGDMLVELRYEDWLKETCNDRTIAARKMENVLDLVDWLARLSRELGEGATLGELVARLSLLGMLERDDEEAAGDEVALMTLHAAKGLEFPHVFIAGLEEGLLPHHQSIAAGQIEEERRLLYVGMTRARRTLTFSYAARRRRGGEIVEREPSRFLSEIPPEDLEWEDPAAEPDPMAMLGRAEVYLAGLRNLLNQN